jgi:hypothetical protein
VSVTAATLSVFVSVTVFSLTNTGLSFERSSIWLIPVPTLSPELLFNGIVLALATAPPARRPKPRTDVAPTAIHLVFVFMMFPLFIRCRRPEVVGLIFLSLVCSVRDKIASGESPLIFVEREDFARKD